MEWVRQEQIEWKRKVMCSSVCPSKSYYRIQQDIYFVKNMTKYIREHKFGEFTSITKPILAVKTSKVLKMSKEKNNNVY